MQQVLSTIIKIPSQSLKKGVAILDLAEYRELQARSVPTYYLKGKKALALDRMVERGLREYREGKTIRASSLREAAKIYERRYAKR